jgi:hypothetical protein
MSYPEALGALALYFAGVFVLGLVSKKIWPPEPPPRGLPQGHIMSFTEFRRSQHEKRIQAQPRQPQTATFAEHRQRRA